MSYTPLVRWRNFTLKNLKTILEIIPDLPQELSRKEMIDQIETNMPGYRRTAYQFACQLGIECRGEQFKVQNYLYILNDQGLEKYLKFWLKNYVTPNPYVKADDSVDPINIYYELGKCILESSSLSINYFDFLDEKFGNTGSMDILTNAIVTLGDPIIIDNDKAYINKQDEEILKAYMNKIDLYLPENLDNEVEYFERFSYERFKEFYDLGLEEKANTIKSYNLFLSNFESNDIRNRIVFGAPGTGKSFKLNNDKDRLLEFGGEYERVTFHPDYSYANFVGTYKPVPIKDSDGKDSISYEYVPGPFMRTYVRAIKNCIKVSKAEEEPKPFLLVIEEINRANTAAVFGEVFQLLDRKNNASEYPIQASEDIKKYLSKETGLSIDHFSEIKIPDNMFIWATMNSADQGVFPMDTAFKRRWSFEYLNIDENDNEIDKYYVDINGEEIKWNSLRKAINNYLSEKGVNEDKLLGPFFIDINTMKEDRSSLSSGKDSINKDIFNEVFKNKVLMYLFEDAAKQRPTIFNGVDSKSKKRFSEICNSYDDSGINIFEDSIIKNAKNS